MERDDSSHSHSSHHSGLAATNQLAAMEPPANFIAHSTSHFGLSFMNALQASATENVAFSPWSMVNLLGMILLGTVNKSRTQQEFYRALDIPERYANRTHAQLHETFKQISSASPNGTVSQNNPVLFEQCNFILYNSLVSRINQEYSRDLQTHYQAQVEDFKPGTEDPRGPVHLRLNSLVNKVTHGMIKEIADASLSTRTDLAMVLLNSAYFKGQWAKKFDNTFKDKFLNGGRKDEAKEVDFMAVTDRFRYGQFPEPPPPEDLMIPAASPEELRRAAFTKDLHCSAVEIPYLLNEGKEFSMLLLLPRDKEGVEVLQKKLSPEMLRNIDESLAPSETLVVMPKFNLETKYEPKAALEQLGLGTMFQDGRDLARMLEGGPGLKVSQIVHKTNIRVDERGTEAASVSAGFITYASYVIPREFVATHPFLFIVRHKPTGTPLFMGRIGGF